jgi:hypothetical protein
LGAPSTFIKGIDAAAVYVVVHREVRHQWDPVAIFSLGYTLAVDDEEALGAGELDLTFQFRCARLVGASSNIPLSPLGCAALLSVHHAASAFLIFAGGSFAKIWSSICRSTIVELPAFRKRPLCSAAIS